jgi:hypothetical protein
VIHGKGMFRDCAGGDDPVEGGAVGSPGGAVPGDKVRCQVEAAQRTGGVIDQHGIDVDTSHVVGAEAVGEQARVVAGAGADFQHPHSVAHIE